MNSKKKLGIIGGMGSRAGAFFLKKIIDYSPAESDQEFPEIIFHNNSLTPDRTRAIVYNEPSPLSSLLRSVDLFNRNQVEVIAMGCITAYYYYDQIIQHTDAKVINPLYAAVEHINSYYPGARRIGLLATTGTIRSRLFHKVLNRNGMDVITLDRVKQEDIFMRAVYMKNGFKSAHISDEARRQMYDAMEEISALDVDIIIGGCTEVSIGIDPKSVDLPYLDLLDLLAREMVEHCYSADLVKK
ncbi:aspartate/glutamate racemase family protein [Chitinophaga tropicalis]|uniref:Amino acid racemase n=1 Tax=Chitinophaga tropicalis TaxID=2683588 RepID=A0A7K1UBR0_9BACT|nr:amino acid racemase [Chitinophaga tropicalis]MVT11415.1 amino acid racemase [Chitinophaga tropicalis]